MIDIFSANATLRTLGSSVLNTPAGPSILTSRECVAIALICDHPSKSLSRRELVQRLWPGVEERKSRHSLSQLLYELKTKVGPYAPVSRGDNLIATHISWDLTELRDAFERRKYAKVIELYNGRFMPDVEGIASLIDWRDDREADAAWCVAEALREESFTADTTSLERIAYSADLVLTHHPHLSAAQIASIQAAVRQGNEKRAEHLHARFCETTDDAELPPLEHFLTQTMLTNVKQTSFFVGRDGELKELVRYWRVAQEGVGQVVIVTGESGIGKTHLVDQFLRRAAISGSKLWVATCCAATQRLPYSVARNLFRDNIGSVIPEMRAGVDDAFLSLQNFGATAPDEARHRLTEALTSAAEATAAKACLTIFVDDAQWADQYTALLLSYWAHRLRDHRVFMLLAVRTHEFEQVPEWISADLARVNRIDLRHLSVDSAKEIVRSFEELRGTPFDEVTRDDILWLSAGRPFLLLEALAASAQDSGHEPPLLRTMLTPTAETVLRRRFHNLPGNAVAISEFLAVWGKQLEPHFLAEAVALHDVDVADGLDTLQLRGIVQLSGSGLGFVHDLMRETACRLILPGRRALLHRRSANLAIEANEPWGFIAQHYAKAGDSEGAGRYALKAAKHALSDHLYADYEFYLRLACSDGDAMSRAEAAGSLAMHYLHVGKTTDIAELTTSMSSSDPRMRALELAVTLDSMTATRPAADLVARASELLQIVSEIDHNGVVRILGAVLDVAVDANTPELAWTWINLLDARRDFLSGDIDFQLAAYRAIWKASMSNPAQSLADASKLVDDLNDTHAPSTKALCHYALGTLRLLTGDVTRALRAFDNALAEAESCGDIRRQQAIQINRGVALMEAGDLASARDSLAKALASPSIYVRIRAYTNLAIVHYEAGRLDLAADAAATVLSMNATYQAAELRRAAQGIQVLIAFRNSDSDQICRLRGQMVTGPEPATVFEDTSYYFAARARIAIEDGNRSGAVLMIKEEALRLSDSNRLASLRLQCALAETLIGIDTDQSFFSASQAKRASTDLGANQIARYAESVLELVRH